MADDVNSPEHYRFPNGAEVIDLTENLSFNLGNVVKYVSRAGRKDDDALKDLRKARFYLEREIERLFGDVLECPWCEDEQASWDLVEEEEEVRQYWDLLDEVPERVIVEDIQGWRYRRIHGTSRFQVLSPDRFWTDLDAAFYFTADKYSPFVAVGRE